MRALLDDRDRAAEPPERLGHLQPETKSSASRSKRFRWMAIMPSTMCRLRRRTVTMSTPSAVVGRPYSPARRCGDLGTVDDVLARMHAVFGHEPPISPRSTTTVGRPAPASS